MQPQAAAHADAAQPLLQVSGVAVRFGGIVALGGVSFEVGPRQICGLIGPNGSGKTTLFNCISGIYRPGAGEVRLGGLELPTLLPGITVNTSPTNYHPIRHLQLQRWNGTRWERFGNVIEGAGA